MRLTADQSHATTMEHILAHQRRNDDYFQSPAYEAYGELHSEPFRAFFHERIAQLSPDDPQREPLAQIALIYDSASSIAGDLTDAEAVNTRLNDLAVFQHDPVRMSVLQYLMRKPSLSQREMLVLVLLQARPRSVDEALRNLEHARDSARLVVRNICPVDVRRALAVDPRGAPYRPGLAASASDHAERRLLREDPSADAATLEPLLRSARSDEERAAILALPSFIKSADKILEATLCPSVRRRIRRAVIRRYDTPDDTLRYMILTSDVDERVLLRARFSGRENFAADMRIRVLADAHATPEEITALLHWPELSSGDLLQIAQRLRVPDERNFFALLAHPHTDAATLTQLHPGFWDFCAYGDEANGRTDLADIVFERREALRRHPKADSRILTALAQTARSPRERAVMLDDSRGRLYGAHIPYGIDEAPIDRAMIFARERYRRAEALMQPDRKRARTECRNDNQWLKAHELLLRTVYDNADPFEEESFLAFGNLFGEGMRSRCDVALNPVARTIAGVEASLDKRQFSNDEDSAQLLTLLRDPIWRVGALHVLYVRTGPPGMLTTTRRRLLSALRSVAGSAHEIARHLQYMPGSVREKYFLSYKEPAMRQAILTASNGTKLRKMLAKSCKEPTVRRMLREEADLDPSTLADLMTGAVSAEERAALIEVVLTHRAAEHASQLPLETLLDAGVALTARAQLVQRHGAVPRLWQKIVETGAFDRANIRRALLLNDQLNDEQLAQLTPHLHDLEERTQAIGHRRACPATHAASASAEAAAAPTHLDPFEFSAEYTAAPDFDERDAHEAVLGFLASIDAVESSSFLNGPLNELIG